MWIVTDWLERFLPEARITQGKMRIKGVRYFSEGIKPEEDLLYVGHATDFISTRKEGVICANGEDMILLDFEDAYVVFNEIQRMVEFYNDWEMGIMRAIDEGASLTEILELTLPVLDATILVTDAGHSELGIAHHPTERPHFNLIDGHLSSEDVIRLNAILQQHSDRHGPYLLDDGSQSLDIIRNFHAKNGELIGWFVAMEAGEFHRESRMQLSEAFCHLLDFWFKINESALLFSPQSSLFINILDGKETDLATIHYKQEGIGWEGNPEMQLFVVDPAASTPLDIQYLQKALSSSFSAVYCFRYAADILIIVNYSRISRDEFSVQLASALKKRKTFCGSSFCFRELRELATYYRQAELALRYGDHIPGTINHCEDFTLEYIRQQINESLTVSILSPVLDTLKQYDASAGTEYYKTLGVYLLNERDQTKAADILCVHRNTLIYRIKKIESVISIDLNDSRKRFAVLLSYYISDPEFFL